MMTTRQITKTLWWLIQKDLLRESRAMRVWPETALLGLVLVLLLSVSNQLASAPRDHSTGGLFWLAFFFAGTLVTDRSFGGEREEGCLEALRLYPLHPSLLFGAKLIGNLVVLTMLQMLLIPAFAVLSDTPLLKYPAHLALVAGLANLGYAAVATVLSALTNSLRRQGSLLALLLLPLVAPTILAAAGATQLMLEDRLDVGFWRWVQLLAIFAGLYTTLGLLVFEFVLEE